MVLTFEIVFYVKSISVVKFWQFMLATVCFLPKILLAVFIGSRIAKFSDKEQRGQMDTGRHKLSVDILSLLLTAPYSRTDT